MAGLGQGRIRKSVVEQKLIPHRSLQSARRYRQSDQVMIPRSFATFSGKHTLPVHIHYISRPFLWRIKNRKLSRCCILIVDQ